MAVKKKVIEGFSKDALIQSKKYSAYRDLLNALLENEKYYTYTETDKIINDFLKGKVVK